MGLKRDTGKLVQAFDETDLEDFTNTCEAETFQEEVGGEARIGISMMNKSNETKNKEEKVASKLSLIQLISPLH